MSKKYLKKDGAIKHSYILVCNYLIQNTHQETIQVLKPMRHAGLISDMNDEDIEYEYNAYICHFENKKELERLKTICSENKINAEYKYGLKDFRIEFKDLKIIEILKEEILWQE